MLRDVSFAVEDGEFVGITGPSGSGKSTLLRLVLGLDRPASGRILFDGQDQRLLSRRNLANHIGASLQNGQLYPGTLFDNIRGTGRISLADARGFAALAGMDRDLAALPMGLRTAVGEAGAGLSRGQIQRLLLARALARQPRVLILDEALAALDIDEQITLMRTLNTLGVTRLVVTHQLHLLGRADRVIVLRDGAMEATTNAAVDRADLPIGSLRRSPGAHSQMAG